MTLFSNLHAHPSHREFIAGVAADIAALKSEHPQLEEFSPERHADLNSLRIQYAFRTGAAKGAGGWTAGVPNPRPDGLWFHIDLHAPGSTDQLHTQPMVPDQGEVDGLTAWLLILEGTQTKPVAGALSSILARRGAVKITPLNDAEEDALLKDLDKKKKIDASLLHRALKASHTTLRARAAMALGETGGPGSIPHLINALSDMSQHLGATYPEAGMETTRYWANASLTRLTQQDFGFLWNDPEEKRALAISRWRQWHGGTATPQP